MDRSRFLRISETEWQLVALDCENHPETWSGCKTQTVRRQSRSVIPKSRTSSALPCSTPPTLSNTFGRNTGKKPALSFSGNHDLIKCSVVIPHFEIPEISLWRTERSVPKHSRIIRARQQCDSRVYHWIDRWMNKVCCAPIRWALKRKEILGNATAWKNLEGTKVSEISHKKTNKYYMASPSLMLA